MVGHNLLKHKWGNNQGALLSLKIRNLLKISTSAAKLLKWIARLMTINSRPLMKFLMMIVC